MTNELDLSLCVAMTPERVIGRDNTLPWTLPSDMARFRQFTTEVGTIVMGRKTYESILSKTPYGKPLAGRHHIVLSRVWSAPPSHLVEFVTSLQGAFTAIEARGGRACIVGGEQIYRLFLPFVSSIHVTMVHTSIQGDAYFPEELSGSKWRRTSCLKKFDQRDEYPISFLTFERATR